MQLNYLIIDERGDLFSNPDQPAILDAKVLAEAFQNLRLTEKFVLTTKIGGDEYIVESFDHPIQAKTLVIHEKEIVIISQHGFEFAVNMDKWSVDEWDRFNGLTQSGAPFVLSEKAQGELFQNCESFDDEGFVIGGKFISTPPYYYEISEIEKSQYWMDVYSSEGNPGWNLNDAAEAFKDMLPRLKLPKSRVLVLGCGEGHDAALFAKAGHVVTAVDFSETAIKIGRQKYGDLANLSFVQQDIFTLPVDWNHSFDIVVEHTCFCAIPPHKRPELVKLYRRMLHDEGQLMAVFFAMDKRSGPPFGSTEWEIRKRTTESFQYLFWGRLRNSVAGRMGRELFVLGKKR